MEQRHSKNKTTVEGEKYHGGRAGRRNANRGSRWKELKAERELTGETRREQDRRRHFERHPDTAGVKTGSKHRD